MWARCLRRCFYGSIKFTNNKVAQQLDVTTLFVYITGIAVDWVNRYLYFTNYGWESHERTFARIEMIRLDGTDRKVIIHEGLDKPRDIVIDQLRG